MNLKDILNIFVWKPEKKYNFVLPDFTYNVKNNKYTPSDDLNNNNNGDNDNSIINTSISYNLEYIRSRFNTLINSDIVIRKFNILAHNKKYKAFLLFIDGMIDSNLVSDFVLKPLMLHDNINSFNNENNDKIKNSLNIKSNKVIIKKVKKINISEYILNHLIPQNNVSIQNNFNQISSSVNSGNCALFIDTLNIAFDIDVKGFKQRNVDSPSNEVVIKGPQEAFVENIRTNTSLIRKIINSENLIIENAEVGSITKTKCAICYMGNIANNDLVSEVKYRLNNLEIDSLLSSGQLEELIIDGNQIGVPEIISTERPDKTAKYILQGRVGVIVNGSPYCLIMPATIIDYITSPEDTNLKPYFANFLRVLRFLSVFITLLLPGMYVAITSFHQEILPTELLYSILGARETVPFPVIFEIIIMEISFELIREAGLRVPSPVGPTIGIVGALVLGQAAVAASIVSPILIIIVAITGIASFAIIDFSFGFHLRFFRFIFILLGYIAGFLGIAIGLFVYISIICNVKSFGVSFTAPFDPSISFKENRYFILQAWRREYRAPFLITKKPKSQEHISMKWKK